MEYVITSIGIVALSVLSVLGLAVSSKHGRFFLLLLIRRKGWVSKCVIVLSLASFAAICGFGSAALCPLLDGGQRAGLGTMFAMFSIFPFAYVLDSAIGAAEREEREVIEREARDSANGGP